MAATRYYPVVVLLDDETIERLRPAVDAVAWVMSDLSPEMAALIATRGWTPEMVAWGRLLHDLAERFNITVEPR